MTTYQVHITMKSGNAKTGPIPVSTTSYATCPTSCVFRKNGCYADSGPLALHWKAVTEGKRGTDWATFCDTVAAMPEGTFWRHNQAGDLPSDGTLIDSEALAQLVEANKGKRGFTYTHHDATLGLNYAAIKHANANGFTVNLSANDLEHADVLSALDCGPVVVVVPSDAKDNTYTPKGRKVVLCPATQRDDISCATCQLCQRPSGLSGRVIVAFPAHGTSKKKADVVARKVFAIVPLSR